MANSENRITSVFGSVSNANQSIGSTANTSQQNQIHADIAILAEQLTANLTKLELSADGVQKVRDELRHLVSGASAGDPKADTRGRLLSIKDLLSSTGGNLLSAGILAMINVLIEKL